MVFAAARSRIVYTSVSMFKCRPLRRISVLLFPVTLELFEDLIRVYQVVEALEADVLVVCVRGISFEQLALHLVEQAVALGICQLVVLTLIDHVDFFVILISFSTMNCNNRLSNTYLHIP